MRGAQERVVQVDRRSNGIQRRGRGCARQVRRRPREGFRTISRWWVILSDRLSGPAGHRSQGCCPTDRPLQGALEEFPAEVLGERRELALLFKRLATCAAMPVCSRASKISIGGAPRLALRRAPPLGDARLAPRAEAAYAAVLSNKTE